MNPTVALTLILLFLMVAAGFVSAAWGYAIGREALKGITQPDVRPSTSISDASGVPRREEVTILKEADILADVKAQMEGNARTTSNISSTASPAKATMTSASPSPASDILTAANSSSGLPITAQDQGVMLEVRAVRQQEGALVMDVSLTNRGSQPVKFLYSFINVTDNQGRSFSANTDGLPGELLPNGELFTGTISIPMALLDDSNNLTVSLTDYPEQRLQLQLSDVPIVR